MKLFLVAFAVIAAVAADVSHLPSNEYLPPGQEQASAPSSEYLPPGQEQAGSEDAGVAHDLADDGYRYKTHRRVVYRRHRRDVSHLPSNDYLPPSQEGQADASEPIEEIAVAAIEDAAPAHELADDGYRYKTHRRVVYRRNRRDVSHLPSNDYLPPSQEGQADASEPIEESAAVAIEEAAPAHELADDGYRYKTHRRVVYRRNRRDVSHLPSSEYLPPGQEQASAPSSEYLPPGQEQAGSEDAGVAHDLADDGYRYKTHRRVVYRRHRRDVSHLPSSEYLPPGQEQASAPSSEYLPPGQEQAGSEDAGVAHDLADDGYRYKTHRRVVYRRHRRHRRDVSHLPSNEYLPPGQEQASAPSSEYLPPGQEQAGSEDAGVAHDLADDGYRYKTHRRVVYRRHRRDVSHLPSNDYLPPSQEGHAEESAPIEEVAVAAIEEAAPAHELADDGYRYKTHRRVVYRRNRRDVSHLPSNEYLPPGQQEQSGEAVASQIIEEPVVAAAEEEAEPAHQLADDGYRYKTHRRVVYRRHRRDVSHLPSSEYLPPGQEQASAPSGEYLPPGQEQAGSEDSAVAHDLADDGYRYKTHRRVVYRRHRRDVSHLPSNDYLPPSQEGHAEESAPIEEIAAAVEEAAPAHELAADGYRYKTHRRVVYRRH